MTIKEANEAARQRLPVIFDGMEFERIIQVGIRYNENGKGRYFLQILDRTGNSTAYVEPSRCELSRSNE